MPKITVSDCNNKAAVAPWGLLPLMYLPAWPYCCAEKAAPKAAHDLDSCHLAILLQHHRWQCIIWANCSQLLALLATNVGVTASQQLESMYYMQKMLS